MWLSSDIVVREEQPQPEQPTIEQGYTVEEGFLVRPNDVKTTKTTIPFFKNNELDYSWFTGGH